MRKSLTLALLGVVLACAVYLTFALKDERYGSTPPFASFGLALEELARKARYGLEKGILRMSQTAGGAFTLFGGELSADNIPSRSARAVPVLTYHRIVNNAGDLNNVTERLFEEQMRSLKRAGWQTVTLRKFEEFLAGERDLPEKSFLITFDDGAKESFYPVDPLFDMLGYSGVAYIIANATHTPESTYYLSPTEIQRMLASGRWEIGSHSFDGHRLHVVDGEGDTGIFFADKLWNDEEGRLETADEFTARVRDDLLLARGSLEKEYGVTIDSFAFPLGNETGIEGAANFPEGASITEREARRIYSLGFLQTNGQTYTYAYPSAHTFVVRRIHVDHDWSGERLVRELEEGLPKDIPFEDDFSSDRGWIPSWGALDLGRNNLSLAATANASSVSTFLDGAALWDDYSFNASVNWRRGSVFLLADVADSKTYDACAFSPGVVRIQSTAGGESRTLAETRDARIEPGTVSIGVRVHGTVIECLWNYGSVVEVYERRGSGGIGFQAWDPALGTATLQVSEVLVRPFE